MTASRVQLQAFLATAEARGWPIGVEPTVGLACRLVPPRALLELVAAAEKDAAEDEDEGDDE